MGLNSLKHAPMALMMALGCGATQFHFPGALASSLPLVAQAKAPAGAAHSADDDHDHTSKAAAAGVLDEATLNSMRSAPLPKQVTPEVAASVEKLVNSPQVRQALSLLKSDEARYIKEAIQISEIPAPTFAEAKRAKAYAALLKANGLSDVRIDSISNVIGVRKGTGNGPKIAIVAHLDTVFDAKTDVKVKKKGDVLYGPGLTDDSAALASMLSWLRAMDQAKIKTPGDLYFMASVGEEGLGNLRGIKQLAKDYPDIAGYMMLEPVPMPVAVTANTGVTRLLVTFTGPGGHSWGAYGQVPSANHALGRLIAKIADMPIPTSARTSFTVGIIKGGRSVNTISPDASLELDIRSLGNRELQAVAKQVETYAQQAVAEENKRWGVNSLKVSMKDLGGRPGGMTPPDHPIVHGWMAAAQSLGVKPILLAGASTDAAIPMSQGIPALVLGFGGVTGGFHALDENWNPTNAYKGVQLTFLTTLAMAGVDGVSQPLVPQR
jgi:acetylornithine deacetylase/succinyl-diaminopimelate desuccinylase-like protein